MSASAVYLWVGSIVFWLLSGLLILGAAGEPGGGAAAQHAAVRAAAAEDAPTGEPDEVESAAAQPSVKDPAAAGAEEAGAGANGVGVATGGRNAPPADEAEPAGEQNSSEQPEAAERGELYTWRDGERTGRVRLQPQLVLQPSSANVKGDVVLRDDGRESIVERRARHAAGGLPVFRNEGGSLVTLPGGVLLVLDPGWDQSRINRFFSANAIKASRVTPQAFADNAFLVATEPGFASLELANALAEQDGVLIASPDWRSQIALR